MSGAALSGPDPLRIGVKLALHREAVLRHVTIQAIAKAEAKFLVLPT